MLQVNKVSKSYGVETILDEVSFVLNPGECFGFVGPNGSGKSTLLKIITNEETPDSGTVSLSPEITLGYLPQGLPQNMDKTVGEVVRSGIEGLEASRREVERLASQMTGLEGEKLDTTMQAYGEALTRFEALGGYTIEHKVQEVLAGLGLSNLEPDQPISFLSGGQRTRIGLARILLANPNILLLDEPTNHLDIQALEWLEEFLVTFSGGVLIVSHDRTFLDNTVTQILEIDPATHKLREYPGNYSAYVMAKTREREKHLASWRDQQTEIRKMESDIHRTKMQAKSVELTTTSRQPTVRRYAKKVAKKAKSREKKLKRYLESDERIGKPKSGWRMKLEFGEMPRSGQIVLNLTNLTHRYGDDPALFTEVNLKLVHGERVALLGPNGSGKSTLLQLIAGAFSPIEGNIRLGSNVQVGYMPQEGQTLNLEATPLETIWGSASISETEARNFLHYFLFSGNEVFIPINKLSYGERSRLMLAKLVIEGANFLVLDEPINHLDIPSRERFEDALDAFPGTILAAVHDRAFIRRFATGIWAIEGERIFRKDKILDKHPVSK